MEKRTLIALAVSLMILGFYPMVLQQFYPEYGKENAVKVSSKAAVSSIPETALAKATSYSDGDDVLYKNNHLRLVFNKKDAAVREISFTDFTDYESKGSLRLLALKDSKASPFSIQILEPSTAVTGSTAKVLSADKVFSSSSAFDGRLKIEKTFSFRPSGFASDVTLRFKNDSDAPIDFQYEFFAGSRIPPRHSIDEQYIEANFFYQENGKPKLRHIRESKEGKKVESGVPVEWLSIKDRHFSIILKPAGKDQFSGLVRGMGDHHFSASLVSQKISIPARSETAQEFLVYVGPNEIDELLPLGLGELVNFGKLDLIGKLLVGALEMIQKVVKNYGVAIIVLTTLLNIVLFPMTRVSYMSMKRMQLIQPQVIKLREQHKKNPEKLNRETMELYKKHKVNPFGGCLPMLLQMPVFIALYVALSKSVILIDASFLWVKDLSSPDRVFLPFSIPGLGNELHVLPLIMVVGMFFQQKFTQIKMEGQDPAMESQQKIMATMMPVVFGFIFYTMPSGLVLYWLTNTVLMTSYQLYLKKLTLT